MDRPLILWLYKTARRNLWRVYPVLSYDDLVQEGLLVYSRLRVRYPSANARHMQALLARSYANHIHNLANKRRRTISTWAVYDVEGLEQWLSSQPCDYAELLLCIAEAPPRVRRALQAILAPENQNLWHAAWKRRTDGTRETFNERLGAMIGLQSPVDLYSEIRSYLTEGLQHA